MRYKVCIARVEGEFGNRVVELPEGAIVIRGILNGSDVLVEVYYLLPDLPTGEE
jgi:hypothetical protein